MTLSLRYITLLSTLYSLRFLKKIRFSQFYFITKFSALKYRSIIKLRSRRSAILFFGSETDLVCRKKKSIKMPSKCAFAQLGDEYTLHKYTHVKFDIQFAS